MGFFLYNRVVYKGDCAPMTDSFNRMRVWAEQGNVTIPQLFFQFYKQLHVTDEEALFMMHLLAFHSEGVDFPTPLDVEKRTHFSLNTIAQLTQRLMQKGLLELKQLTDEHGKIYEKYSLYPLWERILDCMAGQQIEKIEQQEEVSEREIFQLFERELGRLLSPFEIEMIGGWLDKDRHTPTLIKAALKEAVLADKVAIRYVDRILIEWKKKNIQTMEQVEKHAEQFRQNTVVSRHQPVQTVKKTTPPVPFYNWLEERE